MGVPEWMATRGTKKGTEKEIEEGELGLVRTRAGPPPQPDSLTARDAARLDFRGGHGVRVRYVERGEGDECESADVVWGELDVCHQTTASARLA